MNAIVFLTRSLREDQEIFYNQFLDVGYDLFIVIGSDTFFYEGSNSINVINVNSEECIKNGFFNFNHRITDEKIQCGVWDKALYYCTQNLNNQYENIWFIEDDVFIPSLNTIPEIDKKYGDADILSAFNQTNDEGDINSWMWWKYVPQDILPLPWAQSMVSAVRLSNTVLQLTNSLVKMHLQQDRVFFVEYIFHTLAKHNNLSVKTPLELRSLTASYSWKLFEMNKHSLYHPLEDLNLHTQYRKSIASRSDSFDKSKLTDFVIGKVDNHDLHDDFYHYLIIRSYDNHSVLSRVQSDPLFKGLQLLGQSVKKIIYSFKDHLILPNCSFLIFSYDDAPSIDKAISFKKKSNCKLVCLGSDIHGLDHYAQLSVFVDYFVVPTGLHKEILQSAVWTKVIVMPESYDSIALDVNQQIGQTNKTNEICWFGYPESFEKSFNYIFSRALIQSGFSRNSITFITSKGLMLQSDVRHLEFDVTTFYMLTQQFGYSLLSHFPHDCHINTFIKSPNKLITSLVRGLIPLVSNTKNYRDIMQYYNLDQFMFSSGFDLVSLLQNLDCHRDHEEINFNAIALDLMDRYSPENVSKVFLDNIN